MQHSESGIIPLGNEPLSTQTQPPNFMVSREGVSGPLHENFCRTVGQIKLRLWERNDRKSSEEDWEENGIPNMFSFN